jgi:hypothetical protein
MRLPMDLNSTPFVKYQEIKVDDTDIYDDAWGLTRDFSDVLNFLGKIDNTPAGDMSVRLIEMIHTRS